MKVKNLLIIVLALCCGGLARAQDTGRPRDKESMPQKPAYRVAPGVANGNLLRKVDPQYPEEAKRNHVQGEVILQATIDRDGNIANLTIASGPAILAQAAFEAVRQWKYRPYKLNGEAVAVQTTIKIRFQL